MRALIDSVNQHPNELICDPFSMEKQLALGLGRVTQRYNLLIEQLYDDYAKRMGVAPGLPWDERPHGWQTSVAGELGVSQSYLWQVARSGLEPTTPVIELACKKVRISEAFFFGTFQTDPDYRDFQGVSRMPEMGYPALRRFYESDGFGLHPTEQERFLLSRQEWEGEPTERTYDLFLQALRSVKMATVTEIRSKQAKRALVKAEKDVEKSKPKNDAPTDDSGE